MATVQKKYLKLHISTTENQPKVRVDKFITNYLNQMQLLENKPLSDKQPKPSFSRSQIQQWIKENSILVDEKVVSNKTQIGPNQNIQINANLIKSLSQQNWQASKIEIPFDIVYEDGDLLVINKPAGLVVHPGAGHQKDTLINGLLVKYPELQNISRNGIIHRIDKDTSGLLCVAKNQNSHHLLTEQMNTRQIEKIYLALVNGNVISGGIIDEPIVRSSYNRLKQVVHKKGKQSITKYTVKKKFKTQTLLKINLLTGRTHQIRVHLKHIGFPIVGDHVYHLRKGNFIPKGSSDQLIKALQSFKRQALHAYQLKMIHPSTKKYISFKAEIPSDFSGLLDLLNQEV